MKTPPAQQTCFLLPQVCDVIRMRLHGKRAAVCTPCPPVQCFRFDSGALSGTPALEDVRLEHTHASCCLNAVLCLPVTFYVCTECSRTRIDGVIRLPIQAAIRTTAPVQYIPQAEVCIHDLQLQDGCLCAVFDLNLTLYAVQPQPVKLSVPCEPDCAPFFGIPLYPELPCRTKYKGGS